MKKPISIARLAEAATMRRSSLYVWMLDNHDAFAKVVADAVRPNWTALAAAFASEGQTDADGKPPTAECTRQTWWKVRKTVKARRASTAKRAGAQPAGDGETRLNAPVRSPSPLVQGPGVPQPEAGSEPEGSNSPKHTWTPTRLK